MYCNISRLWIASAVINSRPSGWSLSSWGVVLLGAILMKAERIMLR
jgi:hypothetical protein